MAGLLATAALLGGGQAAADCIDPMHCICRGDDVFAAEVIAIDDTTAELEIIGVAASEKAVAVGDLLSADADRFSIFGERVLIRFDSISVARLERVPPDGMFSCIDATFSLQETLDLSASDSCRQDALEAADKEHDEVFNCDDTVSFFDCSVGHPSPRQPGLPWMLVGLPLLGGLLLRRRHSRR